MNPMVDPTEQLQKLLALKRHEKPPPGYFHTFSNNVMARINASEGDAEGLWLAHFWQRLTARPILSGALAAGVFGVLLFCLLIPASGTPQHAAGLAPAVNAFADGSGTGGTGFERPIAAAIESVNSTNPVNDAPSLFEPVGLKVQKVNYQMNGN